MRRTCLALVLGLGLLACGDARRYDQAIGVLIDVSGTYAGERAATVDAIKRGVLPAMLPGDTLLVVRIDGESYDRENVEALLTLDRRPSRANAQKLALAHALDAFAAERAAAAHTDIPGAIMLAAEFLAEVGAESRVMLVFSDLQEDLPPGARRELGASELAGTRVAAVNVKRLRADSADPEAFRGRLATWERRVRAAGAVEWRNLLDTGRLAEYLAEARRGPLPG